MKIGYLQKPQGDWLEKLPITKNKPRHWRVKDEIKVTLSDGYELTIPKGYVWDGASVPKWLWWLFKPIDSGALGDCIHDKLWEDKQAQFEYFEYKIYDARLFADNERNNWRKALTEKGKKASFYKFKNKTTHFVIRALGGFFYSKQLNIPR